MANALDSNEPNPSANSQLWVEPAGTLILARVRGRATQELIIECQQRVALLQSETGRTCVLYDALELERPSLDVVLTQQELASALNHPTLKVAIVVPNTGIAYLSRLAFGDANHRVFYNDIGAAVRWLEE